jgi:hypothetical protein
MSSLDAAVDAGTQVVGATSVIAPSHGAPDWSALFLTTTVVAAVIALIGGVVVAVLNSRSQRALEALKTALSRELTERTERLRHELAGDLARNTRRAEYVRGQIDHLYGPLAFFVESSDRHIATNQAIMEAADKFYDGRFSADQAKLAKEQNDVIDTGNRYMALVVENNKDAIQILRAGWGWLDPDDISSAGQYLTDVARHSVEFEEEGRKLPVQFYALSIMKSPLGIVSFIRPEFIERVRQKLLAKQKELGGLTGATEPRAPEPPPA